MRLSHYFLPVLKETPAEAQIASHRLMLRAGMIRQSSAGIYSWLPLGLKVMKKIENIIRQEQDRIGCLELLMPTLQSPELWQESGRYDDYGKEMLRMEDRHGRTLIYGPTNEELITDIFRKEIRSYKDLPKNFYHVQWKFRDEIRPRFGVMRGREFLMKDAYSFDLDAEAAKTTYYKQFTAYLRTFKRMGLNAIPMQADSGPIGGDLTHEFVVLASTGESGVFYDKAFLDLDPMENVDIHNTTDLKTYVEKWTKPFAATDEVYEESQHGDLDLVSGRGIEVGHIFYFADYYSKPLKAQVQSENGDLVHVHMGSYGVGVSRLLGAVIESSHDENGIIWPESVAPYDLGLLCLNQKNTDCVQFCDQIYQDLKSAGLDVLYDDRDERVGVKFNRMDLIGLPWQVALGPKGVEKKAVEVKCRKTGERFDVAIDDLLDFLKSHTVLFS